MIKLGVQLYAMRDVIAKRGLDEVLDLIRKAKFDGVELAGNYSLSALELKEKIVSRNLTISGAHVSYELLQNVDEQANFAKEAGYSEVVLPSVDSTLLYEDYPSLASKLSELIPRYKAQGIDFSYHNHDFEFTDKTNYLAKFAKDISQLNYEIDIAWIKNKNIGVEEIANIVAGKISFFHIKELAKGKDPFAFTPKLGDGISDIAGAVNYAKKHNIEWLILETENFDIDTFEYLSSASNYLRALLAQ